MSNVRGRNGCSRWGQGGRARRLLLLAVFLPVPVLGFVPTALLAGGDPALDAAIDPAVGVSSGIRYDLRCRDAAGNECPEDACAEGAPGDAVTFDLFVEVDRNLLPLKSIEVAINYDARLLSLTRDDVTALASVEPILQPVDALATDVRVDADPRDAPGNEPEERGFVFVRLDAGASAVAVPPESPERVFSLRFLIRPSAGDPLRRAVRTAVVLEDVGPIPTEDGASVLLQNAVELHEADPEDSEKRLLSSEDLDDGCVVILGLGEIGFFRRGDATFDCEIDISDPIRTFESLFLEKTDLPCHDALDANDSGDLDITDGIYTLNWLFSGGRPLNAPELWGPDPSADGFPACDSGVFEHRCGEAIDSGAAGDPG